MSQFLTDRNFTYRVDMLQPALKLPVLESADCITRRRGSVGRSYTSVTWP